MSAAYQLSLTQVRRVHSGKMGPKTPSQYCLFIKEASFYEFMSQSYSSRSIVTETELNIPSRTLMRKWVHLAAEIICGFDIIHMYSNRPHAL